MEKVETAPKMDISIIEKQDKPEKIEKIDHLDKKDAISKKTDSMDKTQKSEHIIKDGKKVEKEEKQDNKAEKVEKIDKPEKTNKEKEDKKDNGEKVDKTAKAEKNAMAAKRPAKSPTANGSKEVTSPDSKAKVSLKKGNSFILYAFFLFKLPHLRKRGICSHFSIFIKNKDQLTKLMIYEQFVQPLLLPWFYHAPMFASSFSFVLFENTCI